MGFATDSGYVFGKKSTFEPFSLKERQERHLFMKQWFRKHGYEIILLPEDLYFEGNAQCIFGIKNFLSVSAIEQTNQCAAISKNFSLNMK